MGEMMGEVSELTHFMQRFSWVDYVVFVFMLAISAVVGVYWGFMKKQTTQADYLLGGRNMKVIPVSMSLVASFVSGITLLGSPTEVYMHGTQYAFIIGAIFLMSVIMTQVYLPVFYELKITSNYEYLSIRFDNRVRLFGSILFAFTLIGWLPIVIYVPALAFNQVTGVDIHVITPIVCLVCIFYTSAGGLQAVVWTDVIQITAMFGAMALVAIKGTIDVGGIGVVFQRNLDSGRIEMPNSLSTSLNSMSAVVLEDFYKPFFKKPLTDRQASWIMKGVVIILGTLCVVFIVEKMGTILQLTMTLESMTMGPQLGVFTMGILMPWVDATGALVGGVSGLAVMSWWCLTSQLAIARGQIVHSHKSLSTAGCTYNFTAVEDVVEETVFSEEVNPVLRVSYMWYTLAGMMVSICVGAIVSRINRARGTPHLPPAPCLLAPQLRRLYKEPPHPTDDPFISAYGQNKYLELRYDKRLRVFGSVLFSVYLMAWLPIVIYVPALAFNQVTGVNIHITTSIVCFVCIFYTSLGGLKAVVWTDVIQTIVMIGAMVLVIIKGTIIAGGLGEVFRENWNTGRVEIPPAIWGFFGGVVFIVIICGYSGLLAYAKYHECDPLDSRLALAKDQLLPLLVMDVLGDWPGMPGIFVAGVFSASLSSLSTGLNSMAAVVLEDFWKPFFKPLTQRQTQIMIRSVVVVLGVICVASMGPLAGVFLMGIFLPFIDATSALSGGIIGLSSAWWLAAQSQLAQARGLMQSGEKPRFTQNCTYEFDEIVPNMVDAESEVPYLYRISFMWFTAFGCMVTVGIACIVNFRKTAKVHPDHRLFAPFIRKWLEKDKV
ncbi:hypothetical protein HF086_004648 [Spodoptera exigua]|uniref:Sodium-coupled monocarboxylate transporter 1 n=1 Tax=Spodoptera exigua TaxID=7107 RepID=A0A922SBB4_SPOEX|nr:hypothetical protein HF086_004648 [Spodoptera exigua]